MFPQEFTTYNACVKYYGTSYHDFCLVRLAPTSNPLNKHMRSTFCCVGQLRSSHCLVSIEHHCKFFRVHHFVSNVCYSKLVTR